MRSPREIAFRLRQEIGNAAMAVSAPRWQGTPPAVPFGQFPHPEQVAAGLRGSQFASTVAGFAEDICLHRFALLGYRIETGPEIRWKRDLIHGIEAAAGYFRRVPYLDFARAGDHKIIWELNRHQHLVTLAQAYRLRPDARWLKEIEAQLESWWRANPFLDGINWTSALEVAFRALSWIWVDHLVGEFLPAAFRQRFVQELYRHGRYLELNLSVYFSPNTHLLGEAVALYAIGKLYPCFDEAGEWLRQGGEQVSLALERQVREDGSHFEQSAYYHVYALDFFLLHQILSGGALAAEPLRRMADYLNVLLGTRRVLPLIGDDDGGRLFFPYGRRDCFGRATLATANRLLGGNWRCEPEDFVDQGAWWLGGEARVPRIAEPLVSRAFQGSGVVVMTSGDTTLVVDAGPFGEGSGGHSHSDTLGFVLDCGVDRALLDPGTFTYISDPAWRDWFRGSAAHNTVRVDGKDQATPSGPFRWLDHPRVRFVKWTTSSEEDHLVAACEYAGVVHQRSIRFRKPGRIEIVDEVSGGGEAHTVEQFWHPGEGLEKEGPRGFRIGSRVRMELDSSLQVEEMEGWRSEVLGEKKAAPVIRGTYKGPLPVRLTTVLQLAVEV